MRLCVVLFITGISFATCLRGEWIDPHDMDSKPTNKLKMSTGQYPAAPYCEHNNPKTCTSDVYLKRIIRLLLNHANFNLEDADPLIGNLHLHLRRQEYELLLKFARSDKTDDSVLSEVHSIFENAFQEPFYEALLTNWERFYLLIYSRITAAILGVIIVCYITYVLLKSNFTFGMVLKFFLFLLYVADCAITYIKLIQKAEINNMVKLKTVGTIPPECDPNKMNWWTYIASTFGENRCKEYYEANYDGHKFLVSPINIFTYQLRELIVDPVGDFGEAIGKFSGSLYSALPWYVGLLLFPFIFLVLAFVFCVIISFFTGSGIEMGSPFLFMLRFKGNNRRESQQNQRAPRGETVRCIHMHNNRSAIQDVKNHSSPIASSSTERRNKTQNSANSIEFCSRTPNSSESSRDNTTQTSANSTLSSDNISSPTVKEIKPTLQGISREESSSKHQTKKSDEDKRKKRKKVLV